MNWEMGLENWDLIGKWELGLIRENWDQTGRTGRIGNWSWKNGIELGIEREKLGLNWGLTGNWD